MKTSKVRAMKYTNEERLKFARSHKAKQGIDKIHESVVYIMPFAFGRDGFGWVRDEDGKLIKMPHAGNVVIEKDVSLGAFVCIDRAVVGSTVIGEGTKIDNLVHIAHGAKIGKHNTIAAGSIIEGSCEIGDYNQFGAGVIVQTKVKIGSYCIFGSGAVVTKDVEDYSVMVGNPAKLLRKNE